MKKEYELLELFAGSRSVGRVAEKNNIKVVSVDWEKYEGIDISKDIEYFTENDINFVPDIVWASPDCATYSIAACSTHRNKDKTPKTEYAKKCDRVNTHVLNLIDEWLLKNPKMIFFIENPRGNMRHMDFMKNLKRHTVWYCKYGDNRAKPTDIWTNSKTWIPRPMCKNYKYDKDGNIINKHCHHESARRGSKTGTQGRKDSYNRSIIPSELCKEIIDACIVQLNEG